MSDMELTIKLSFDDLLKVIDQLTPTQRLIIRDRLEEKPWAIPSGELKKLYEAYQPVRDEADNMSEDDINSVIDAAIKEVRGGE